MSRSRPATTLALAALAVTLSLPAAAVELRSYGAAPAQTPWGKIADAFAAKVAELSGGKLTIKHFHASQLGDEQTAIRQVARGRLDIGFFSNTATSLVVPEYGLLASPMRSIPSRRPTASPTSTC